MTSKIVVNNIEADAGVSTVTFGSKVASSEFVGNLTGTASTATAAATAYGISGSPTLSIGAGTTSAPSLSPSGDSNTGIFFPSADTIAFAEGGAEAARFDSSGRLLVGTSTARSPNAVSAALQLESTGVSGSSVTLTTNSSASPGSCPYLVFSRSGGSSNGSNTIVSSGDTLGSIDFIGADGNDINNLAVRISAQVDNTPGSNDMPGRIVFSTTPDGSAVPVERMRIDSSGNVTLNGGNLILSSGAGIDFSANSNAAGMTSELLDDYEKGTWTPSLTGDSGGSGQTYSVRNGFYVKVGTLVHVCFEVNLTNKGTISGYPIITGMPFNRIPYDAQRTAFAINWENLATSVYSVFASHSGNTQTYFLKASGTSTSATLFASGGGDIANNSRFIGAWTYQSS